MIDEELNERNLNVFNEEASHYLDDEDSNEINDQITYQKDKMKDDALNKKRSSHNNFNNNAVVYQNELNSLQNQMSDLGNEMQEKNHKIQYLLDKHQKKDILINNMKKNLKILTEKTQINDQLKTQANMHINQIQEFENEINFLKLDYLKLQETIVNKDNIINEFSNLSEITKSKFRMFEDANQHLNEENEILRKKLEELQNKFIPLVHSDKLKDIKNNEYKTSLSKLEKELEQYRIDTVKREENLKLKFEEKDKSMKQKFKEREDNLKNEYVREITTINASIEFHKLENEKLKVENKNLKNYLEEIENSSTEKELEYRRTLDNKDKEYEKLKKNLKDLQKDISDLEMKLGDRQSEYNFKSKSQDESFNKLFKEISTKDKRIKELEEEIKDCKTYLTDYENSNKEFEMKCENKDLMIDQLKNQNQEILIELNENEIQFSSSEQAKNKEMEDLINKIKEFSIEKKNIYQENQELRANLQQASEKLSELNDLILDKYSGLEMNYYKEKMNKENIEKKYNMNVKKLKNNNESLVNEVKMLRDSLESKEEEIENLKLKYENKVQNLILKIEESRIINKEENNVRSERDLNFDSKSLLSYRSSKYSFRNNVHAHHQGSHVNDEFNYPVKLKQNDGYQPTNQKSQRQTIDNLKEIINKIDNKMGISPTEEKSNLSFITTKH